jgi:outer membrane protein OmpA-like peptidoglycan-associated protein
MVQFRSSLAAGFAATILVLPLASPAGAQFRRPPPPPPPLPPVRVIHGLAGPGVRVLYPVLREDPDGRAFVMREFDFNRDGLISVSEARAANRAYDESGRPHVRYLGPPVPAPPPPPRPAPPPAPPPTPHRDHVGRSGRDHSGGWERGRMRGYNLRQTPAGAMFTLQDILFETGSAVLRPGAREQLAPLADYLYANPGVTVRIDGHTDSVGSDASNLTLSRNRATSVANALASMDVARSQMVTQGHGESMPVATNATAAGRQLNRRVEFTLLGQNARDF